MLNTWYMGIHRSNWLPRPELAEVPVFISRRVFPKGDFPRAAGRYAVDSGGFTELQHYGRWTITEAQYVEFLRKTWQQCGPFDFAAPMDWMCEPVVINGGQVGPLTFAGTGLSVEEHQRRTVDNFLRLRAMAPDLPIIPVLQGFAPHEYLRCVDMYTAAGVDLTAEPVVGVGSVCRRQHMDEAIEILQSLCDLGIRNLHGFGFKIDGLRQCWNLLGTADSMSWSLDGRYAGPCTHRQGRRSEANCLEYALAWRGRHIHPPRRTPSRQLPLFSLDLELAA